MSSNWYFWREHDLYLHVKLQPSSSHNKIAGLHGEYIKIRLTSPPIEGRANKHLIQFLAKVFAVPQASVSIEKGEQSKIKLVRIISPNNTEILHESYFRQP